MANGLNSLLQVLMANRQLRNQQQQLAATAPTGVIRQPATDSAFLSDRPGGTDLFSRLAGLPQGQGTLPAAAGGQRPSQLRRLLSSDLQRTLESEADDQRFSETVAAKPFTVDGRKIQPGETYEIDGRKITAPLTVERKMSKKKQAQFLADLEKRGPTAAQTAAMNPLGIYQSLVDAYGKDPTNIGKPITTDIKERLLNQAIFQAQFSGGRFDKNQINAARLGVGLQPIEEQEEGLVVPGQQPPPFQAFQPLEETGISGLPYILRSLFTRGAAPQAPFIGKQ